MQESKQLTIAELILRLGSGVFGVSGLGILGIGCIYLINDTTGMCIGFLENIPKMLSYSDDLAKQNKQLIVLDGSNESNESNESNKSIKSNKSNESDLGNKIVVTNNIVNKYYKYICACGFNYLKRGLVIGGMIGGGVGLRFLGTWIGSDRVINWFNGRFGSNYI